jgi:hypothetical protein
MSYPWSFLSRVLSYHPGNWRVQQDVLLAMGLGDFGFIDADLGETFMSFSSDSSLDEIREEVAPIFIQRLVDGAPTIGLDFEALVTNHGKAALEAQEIIHARQTEIEQVRVGVQSWRVDLRELYLTAYGYDVLSALEMPLVTGSEGLELIRHAFAELGFEVKTSKEPVSGVNMSDPLKQAIWWIIVNRSRSWSDIPREV